MADRLTQLQDAVNSVRRPLPPLPRGRGARHKLRRLCGGAAMRPPRPQPPSQGNGRGCGVRTLQTAEMRRDPEVAVAVGQGD